VCRSTEHFESYGLIGAYIACTGCSTILANRRDLEAAPIDHPDPEAWQREGTFVLPGAEATDPADDDLFRIAAA
jgi:hypothetical protein